MSSTAIAYGFSKFIMGAVSDRSNPRIFMAAGLILSACVFVFMGFVPWATSSIPVMFCLLFLNGWFQGMGWPPCGRTMVHWWSQKERGTIVPDLELRAQRRRRPRRTALPARHGMVRRLALRLLRTCVLRHRRRALRARGDARYAAIVRAAGDREVPRTTTRTTTTTSTSRNSPRARSSASTSCRTSSCGTSPSPTSSSLPAALRHPRLGADLPQGGQALHRQQVVEGLLPLRVGEIPGTLLCGWVSDKLFKGNRAVTGIVFMVRVTLASNWSTGRARPATRPST